MNPHRSTPRRLILTLFAGLALSATLGVSVWGQRAALTPDRTNFDIRTDKSTAADALMQRLGARSSGLSGAIAAGGRASQREARVLAQRDAAAQWQRENPALDLLEDAALHTPEVIGIKPGQGWLTAPSPDRVQTLRGFIASRAPVLGLRATDAQDLVVAADYDNPAGNLGWVELQQRVNGLPVFRGQVRGAFTPAGELVRTAGVLAPGLDAATLTTSPALTAPSAIATAAARVGWTVSADALSQKAADSDGRLTFTRGTMAGEPRAWLTYFPLASGVARLAWATEIWGDPDAFLTLVDAETGDVLFRKNMTEYQTQSATYVVYADDSPAPMSPSTVLPGSGTQAPYIARSTVTVIGNEAPNTFNSLGWMTDNVNGGNGWTDGNNVQAGIDRDGVNGVDAVAVGTARVFNPSYDPATQEPLTANYQAGEAADVFYWTNVYHDRAYLLGFTEAAGNFQDNNFARGGAAADRISAEIQDSSGTNNANFATPADGGRGRMQMYIFPGPVPDRSGGLDHDVLLHELTHGLSNRLHSNGAGLSTTMARAMGEGWSDFYARALLSSAGEPANGIYTTGGWVTNVLVAGFTDNYYYGIRRFPYAVMSNVGSNGRPHNPLTFADIDSNQLSIVDGAFAKSPVIGATAFEVHNAGEVWAMALFEARARFITRLGWATGNQRFLQFVTDGMKLDAASPTFLSGRDSIIAAAQAGGTAADVADIWAGFAVRGMGYSASITSLTNTDARVVEAFDLPGLAAASSSIVTDGNGNGHLDPGEAVTVSLCIVNNAATVSGTVSAALAATGGVTSPSGAQSYGPVNPGATVCRSFTFTVAASCGADVVQSLQVTESGAANRTLTYTMTVGTLTAIGGESFDGVTAPVLPSGWSSVLLSGTANTFVTNTGGPDTAPNRVLVLDPAVASDNALVSPAIALPATPTVLQFRHLWDTEPTYDGGVLEISIAGGAYQDIIAAGGTWVSNGYTTLLNTGSALAGRSAWSGASGGYRTTAVKLPPASVGQSVTLRWRLASDGSVAATGWSIDTIQFLTYQCAAAPTVPGPFNKTAPANGATVPGPGVTLTWGAASGATSYEYCIDRTANATCDTYWVSVGSATTASLTGLSPGSGYSWQVRAVNGAGNTLANSGGWFTFATSGSYGLNADVTIDFGSAWGLYTLYDFATTPAWLNRHPLSPTKLAAGDLDGNGVTDIIATFAGYGLYVLMNNTTWVQLHALAPTNLVVGNIDGTGGDDLVATFAGYGTYIYYNNASWSQIHPLTSNVIAVGNTNGDVGGKAEVIMAFPGYGTFAWTDNVAWTQVHPLAADNLVTGDVDGNGTPDLIAQFSGYGEFVLFNNATWAPLHPLAAAGIVAANIDGDLGNQADLVISFPGYGVWAWMNNRNWVQLHPLNPTVMTAGDVDGNGQADIVMSFAGYGVFVYRNNTLYQQVNVVPAEAIVTGRLNNN